MSDDRHLSSTDPDEIGHNNSSNPEFDTVLQGYLSRRGMLKGSLGTAATLILGGGLVACSDEANFPPPPAAAPPPPPPPTVLQLNFSPVAKSLADALTVPAGYTARVLYALGDPIVTGLPDYANNGTELGASFALRAGDHHDGMNYFGLGSDGKLARDSSTRGLICINHENITINLLHMNGPTISGSGATAVRTVPDEVIKEINAHGVAIFEVTRAANGSVSVVRNSTFNRRITPNTPMHITGPAAGSRFLRTLNSPGGAESRGTINNCATGDTPWGTFLTCEENWAGYFKRDSTDNATRGGDTTKAVRALNRYGITQGAGGSYAWASATAADPSDWTFRRWNATQTGTTLDGQDDFRNEPNSFGYVVEIDPFDPASTPKKRTALGRMGHESTAYARPVAGKPVVFYMGDDSRGEYVYKYVSNANWVESDASAGAAAGDRYMNAGTLYAAKFNADGTGTWLPLTMTNPAVTSFANYVFEDQADICINTRLAADAVGATKMDRPEWTAVNPRNGDVYLTLTNNNAALRPVGGVDAANPRAYGSGGNANGHIIRLRETGNEPAATTFTWDIYLFGAPSTADATNVNISGLTAANDFSSPDGIWFDRQGVCWIQTDDGAYTNVTNCMMLAAIPGTVGDGAPRTINNSVTSGGVTTTSTVTTRIANGSSASETNLRRFLVGPRGCEITGIAMTPDFKTMFINIQHPGENTTVANMLASTPESSWPVGGGARPKSATVVITRDDGGTVGGSMV